MGTKVSAPLTITLLTPRELSVLTLPENYGGQFHLMDHIFDEGGKRELRSLISVEGKTSGWVAKSSKVADVLDEAGNPVKILDIKSGSNFFVEVKAEDDEKYIANCEFATKDRRTFTKYYVEDNSAFIVGRAKNCDINIESNLVSSEHAKLTFKNERWVLRDLKSSNGTYVNNERVKPNDDVPLQFGDAIYVMGVTIVVCNGFVAFNNPGGIVATSKKLLPLSVDAGNSSKGDDSAETDVKQSYYYRSPRFMREIEQQKIVIEQPPATGQQNDMPLITTIGPAITMGMASLFSGVMMAYNTISNNGSVTQALPMLVMSLSMLLGMCLWPVITKKYQNSKWIKDERKRQIKYRDYLDRMKEKIQRAGEVQSEILSENIIDAKAAARRVFDVSRNLWERTPNHSDFLNVRLGKGTLPIAAEVEFPKTPFSLDNDSLLDAIGELQREDRTIKDVPIPFSLIENRVAGIVGERERVLKYVKLLVSQIVSLHSYDEVKLVFLTESQEAEAWDWARLLPHVFDNTHTSRYFATNLEEARSLLLSFEKLLADRIEKKQTFDETKTTPYYVVVSASRDIALKTEFVEKLLHVPENYGFSLLCLYDELKFLPKECKSVIDVDAKTNTAKLYDKEDTTGSVTEIALEENLQDDLEDSLFVNVANISLDLDSARYMLPKSISFLDMFEVGKVEHLNIGARWTENSAATTLTTPVGVDQNGEQFMLDLHEKVHGPHGLVAGMTGSGKSEFIITYILSLAVNYNPDEVAFVLIDYKGGGLAGAFENDKVRLPHLAGTITNLDGAAINRSLVSIESELKRRQAVFNHARDVANAGTMDIYSYQRLYREGVVKEPVPHLFIISDEFAELKSQQPEFMDQLISTARIGRSLGVHLILATQKPNGVVSEQIWSNSKFKVCLKVQDKADSQEMIKRPEAAELVDTGRFYLQVGYNEYFALGQSAWCGAQYVERDEFISNKRDERVVAINNLGVEIAAAAPADETAHKSDVRQIVAIISHICDVAKQKGVSARQLWLSPLKEVEFVDALEKTYANNFEHSPTCALIGEVDDPAHQRRLPLVVDTSGGVLVYGSAGSGKFTFVASLLYSLIKNNCAEMFNAYVVDCAAETLNAFRGAPHVGDVVLASEVEKVTNLFKMVSREIKTRKKKFSKFGGGIEEFRRDSGEVCPDILVVIHGFGNFSDSYPDIVERLIGLTREGSKVGINFLLTANSGSEVRYRMSQNFANAFALHLNDESEYSSILGKMQKDVSSIKGRGFCAVGNDILVMQVAHPGADENDVFGSMREFSNELAENYDGFVPAKIPILPDIVDSEFLSDVNVTNSKFPVGVSKEKLTVENFDFSKNCLSIVSGNEMRGITDFVAGTVNVCEARGFDANVVNLRIDDDDDEMMQEIVSSKNVNLVSSKEGFLELVESGGKGAPFTFVFGVSEILRGMSMDEQEVLKQKFTNLGDSSTSWILSATASDLNGVRSEMWVSRALNEGNAIWTGDGINAQPAIRYTYSSSLNVEMPPCFGFIVRKQKCELAKLLSGGGGE